MATVIDQIKSQFSSGSMNLKLIMINVGVFIATLLATVIVKLFTSYYSILDLFEAPSDVLVLLYKPWTILTYMFVHSIDGIGHLFWNMVLLFFAGNLFEQELGGKKLLSTYLLGGVFGFGLFLVGYNLLPALYTPEINETLIGASAAVTAIFVAIGVYMPNYEIRFPFINQSFKLIYIVAFFVLLDIIRLQSSIGVVGANTGGWLAHIGGALYGFLFASQLRKGNNIGGFVDGIVARVSSFFVPKSKLKVKHKKGKTKPPRDDYEYNKQKAEDQEVIDQILDKISKSGYDSLTKVEKDFLFKQSNK